MSRLTLCFVLLVLQACGAPSAPPVREGSTPAAQSTSSPAPATRPASAEIACETPADCVSLTRVCPRAHVHNAGNCIRPYTPAGEHLMGTCSDAHCEVDDQAECDGAAARCLGGGTATFQAYDPPDPAYRRGGCTVRCNAYP